MAKKNWVAPIYTSTIRKKRPGIHSKSRHTNQKTGKYYAGTKYRGQGR